MLSKDLAVKDRRYNAQVFSESAASARMELSRISTQALNSPALSPRELEVAVVGEGKIRRASSRHLCAWEPVLLRHAPAGGGSGLAYSPPQKASKLFISGRPAV